MALGTTPVMGHEARMMFKDDSGGTYATQPFLSESLTHVVDRISNNGIRGTRTEEEKMSVSGLEHNGGTINFNPNRLQLEDWLPFITGSAEAADVYALAETIKKTLYVEIWRGSGGGTYSAGAVSRATFRGSTGGLLELELDLIFKNWADLASATAHALDAGLPYQFSGFVLTIGAQTFHITEFELVIDNMVTDDQFYNAVTLGELSTQGRVVTLDFTAAYSAEGESLTALTMAAAAGELTDLAVTLVCTAPDSHTLTFTIGRLQLETHEEPVTGPDGEILIRSHGVCLGSTTRNDELSITVADAV